MSTVGLPRGNKRNIAEQRNGASPYTMEKFQLEEAGWYSAYDGLHDWPEARYSAPVCTSGLNGRVAKLAGEPSDVYPSPSKISVWRIYYLDSLSSAGALPATPDPQSFDSPRSGHGAEQRAEVSGNEPSAEDILQTLLGWAKTGGELRDDIWVRCELTQFDAGQREKLLPILWNFIEKNRDSNYRIRQVDVGSAIRKFVALMPTERMDDLAGLLNDDSRSPLPLNLEIEVVKMIYRHFMAHPPSASEPFPRLAGQLIKMVHDYAKPRLLVRDGYAAAAAFAIDALVAMRSIHAETAVDTAMQSCRWFSEVVEDDLWKLHDRWEPKNADAARCLAEMLNKKFGAECGKME
ncbi:MAG: hypothetical protein ACP5O1_07900 [Phycisphaerae bacterium]